MRKITARIVHFFIESKVIDETDQEIYEYGLEILSENVMLTVFLILFGVAIGRGVETGIFFVLVLLVKKVLRWIPCKNKARMSYSYIYYLYSISYWNSSFLQGDK